jgi:hypothetical protein
MIVKPLSDLKYLKDFHSGKIKKGLGIGCELDDYIRFKKGQFIMINGLPNVGKTRFILWYFLALSMKHNLKWCIWSGENNSGQLKRDLIQMYKGIDFKELKQSSLGMYLGKIETWFTFIDNRKLYSHTELLNLFANVECDGCLIDPYTGLNHERLKISQYDRNYLFCNDVREFANRTKKTVYVNTHPQTESSRRVYADGHTLAGYVQPPKMSDTEGGISFGNRCDDYMTIHRMTNHPELWHMTELTVSKIKDKETGGKITFDPLRFNYNNGIGFTLGGVNPLTAQADSLNDELDIFD